EGVEEHAERLYHALCDRVLDLCHSGNVRRTAQTGFVSEYAALHAHDDGATDQAAEGLIQTEGAFDNGHQHGRHVVELQHDHVEGHADVHQSLHRNQQVSDLGYTLDATDEYQPQQHCQAQPGVGGVQAKGVIE